METLARTETIEINDDKTEVPDPLTTTTEQIFHSALEDFKSTLTQAQRDSFPGTGIMQVKRKIMSIQHHQERLKTMMNFSRIQFYLERFEEFDSVCQTTRLAGEDSGELSAFIWGPSTYILQVSQEDNTVLDIVLDAYQRFGKRIPDLQIYSDLIKEHPRMMKCIAFMYHDLLQFYRKLVKLLTGRGWKRRFQANWRDYEESFEILLKNFDGHGRVLNNLLEAWEKQASNESHQRLNDHILQSGLDKQISQRHAERYASDREVLLHSAEVTLGMNRRQNDNIMRLQDHHEIVRRHIEQYEQDRLDILRMAREEEEKRREDKRRDVLAWMSTPGVPQSEYHNKFKQARDVFPETGEWILRDEKIFNWMDADTPTKSMLWLHGKKGAGKTVLTSLIAERCMEYENYKTSYFYCREDDTNQNTCVSVLKGLLRQMVIHNEDLLPSCHEKKARGEERLNDLSTIKSLLDMFCDFDMNQFIVIDGLDECNPAEIKPLVQYWAFVVDKCDNYKPGKIRVLLVSQDITEIRKLSCMQSADILRLDPEQSDGDIRKYVALQFNKLQLKFDLTEHETRIAQAVVCSRAEGMFLYAVLTTENLLDQARTRDVKDEIKDDKLPESLEVAYKKIISRLQRTLGPRQWMVARKIFSWLAGAKRPLQFHELQAALSIQTDDRPGQELVDYYNNQLRKDIREICGSLVQVLQDRIEFIHSTTRSHIIKSEQVNERVVECDLTVLCLKYLTFPCFDPDISSRDIERYATAGWYAFQDYAISKWKHHLEYLVRIGLPLFKDPVRGAEFTEKFGAALASFIHFHQGSIAAATQAKKSTGSQRAAGPVTPIQAPPPLPQALSLTLSPPTSQELSPSSRSPTPHSSVQQQPQQKEPDPAQFCQAFRDMPFYSNLVSLWTHVCKHQTSDFKERNKVSLPQLAAVLERVRETLGDLATKLRADTDDGGALRKFYSTHFYKCQRVTCDYFHEGFSTEAELKNHSNRHDRPFQCPARDCTIVLFGFSSNKDRDKHIRNYHPDDEAAGQSQFVASTEARKTKTVAKWGCPLCGKKFTRQAILKAHTDAHYGTRTHACETCGRMFTRSNDRNRHRRIHIRRGAAMGG